MEDLRFTFIGSGNAFSTGGLCNNGFLLGERLLFEAPPQVLVGLQTVGIDPNEIDTVVLSHHHGDHFLGLPFLLLHWKWQGRTRPVRIVGPRDTERLATGIAESVFPGVTVVNFDIEWIEASPGTPLAVCGLEIEPVLVEHDEGLSANLGFGFKYRGRTFAYTGDTRLCDGVLDLARSAEVLISECASRDAVVPVHMNLVDDIPVVRAALPADSQLLLTHISPDVDANGLHRTQVVRDFGRYVV